METIIIIIIFILIIIFLIFFFNKSKEHLNTESVNNIFGLCYDNAGNVKYSNVNITGSLQMKTKTLKDFMLDRIYPVGSFYVQYPNKNSNDIDEAFPDSMSPAKLFGGNWQEQWGNESVFFRTSGPYADENRVDGFQDYALPKINGHSSYVQTNRDSPGGGSDGVFSQYETMRIGTDGGNGHSYGHRNYFDSKNQALSSDLETRARNRQIKVWKRVNLTYNKTYPPLPPNGYNEQYDHIWYEGPYPNKVYNSPLELPNAKTLDDAKRACNENYNCRGIGFQNNKYYISVGGEPVSNGDKNNTVMFRREIKSLIETNNNTGAQTKTKDSEFSNLSLP
jgi:hypothetical protein